MGYTVAKATATYILYGAYKCSKCGKVVRFAKSITTTETDMHGGTTLNKSKLESYKRTAANMAESSLSHKICALLSNVERGNYIDCNLHSKCDCGNVEAWASFRTSLKAISENLSSYKALIALFVGIILAAIIAITDFKSYLAACTLLTIPVALLVYFGINNGKNLKIQYTCFKIPDENRPHLFISKDERETFIAQNYDEPNTDIDDDDESPLKSLKKRGMYNMGAEENENSVNFAPKTIRVGESNMDQCYSLAERLYDKICFEIRDLEAAVITDGESSRHAEIAVQVQRIRDMAYLIALVVRPPRSLSKHSEVYISTYVDKYFDGEKPAIKSNEKNRLLAIYNDLLSLINSQSYRPVDSLSELATRYSRFTKEHNDSYYRVISAYKCAILDVFPETVDSSAIKKNSSEDKEETVRNEQPLIDSDSNDPIKDEKPGKIEKTDILFCKKCGFKLLPDSTFCSKCGAKIE